MKSKISQLNKTALSSLILSSILAFGAGLPTAEKIDAPKELFTTVNLSKEDVEHYFKHSLIQNPSYELQDIEIIESVVLPMVGWYLYFVEAEFLVNGKSDKMTIPFFSNGNVISGSLYDMERHMEYRNRFKPSVPDNLYSDEHIIAGDKKAKHKILVFADPLSYHSRKIITPLFEAVKENPKEMVLYYYHKPMDSEHPASYLLEAVMNRAQKEGRMDVFFGMYNFEIKPLSNVKDILSQIEKELGYKVTEKDLEKDVETQNRLEGDIRAQARLIVQNSPTIFIDGEWDASMEKYKALIAVE